MKCSFSLAFFDLGDTLICRDRPIIEFDTELIASLLPHVPKSTIVSCLRVASKNNKGLYDFSKDIPENSTLEKETKYNLACFLEVFRNLKSDIDTTKIFLKLRSQEIRHSIIPQTMNILLKLFYTNINLGIFTDGRPSRLTQIHNLKLDQYFKNHKLIFISNVLGFSKKDSAFYEKVQQKFQHNPKTTMVYDDDTEVLDLVKSIGYQTTQIKKR